MDIPLTQHYLIEKKNPFPLFMCRVCHLSHVPAVRDWILLCSIGQTTCSGSSTAVSLYDNIIGKQFCILLQIHH